MNWQTSKEHEAELYIGSKLAATARRTATNTTAATVNGETFTITSTGFWTTVTTISSVRTGTILTAKPQKWYSGKYTVLLNSIEYKLFARNNPLCEYVLQSGDTEILTYGIRANKQEVSLQIKGDKTAPVWLHLLLWHLSWAMLTENNADSMVLVVV